MDCGVLYIVGKLLERRCLKWAHIAHLESEAQVMAKRRAGSQIVSLTPDQKKVGNQPDLLVYRQRATYRWKALNKSYNFALDRTSIQGLLAKLWGSKVAKVPVGAISRERKAIWM
jgi:hypothetical protein